jgi:hypothetical protein
MMPIAISIDNEDRSIQLEKRTRAELAKRRYDARNLRKEREGMEREERVKQKRADLIRRQSESMQQ